MFYSLQHIADRLQVPGNFPDVEIRELLLDSRKLSNPSQSLFFALKGDRRDGHHQHGPSPGRATLGHAVDVRRRPMDAVARAWYGWKATTRAISSVAVFMAFSLGWRPARAADAGCRNASGR